MRSHSRLPGAAHAEAFLGLGKDDRRSAARRFGGLEGSRHSARARRPQRPQREDRRARACGPHRPRHGPVVVDPRDAKSGAAFPSGMGSKPRQFVGKLRSDRNQTRLEEFCAADGDDPFGEVDVMQRSSAMPRRYACRFRRGATAACSTSRGLDDCGPCAGSLLIYPLIFTRCRRPRGRMRFDVRGLGIAR